MFDEIYNKQIFDFAARIDHIGRLQSPDASTIKYSKICGSTVTVDLKVVNDTVSEFAHQVRACVLGQASSAIMAQVVVGSTASELRDLRQTMLDMLINGAPPPTGKYADFACLAPVKNIKSRQSSVMLTFDAVIECIEQIERSQSGNETQL